MSVDDNIQKGLEAHYDLREHRDYLEKKMQVYLINLIVLDEYLGYPNKELKESFLFDYIKKVNDCIFLRRWLRQLIPFFL